MKTEDAGYEGYAPVVTQGKASDPVPASTEYHNAIMEIMPDFDKCQLVHTNGGRLFLGNKIGALSFYGSILCVLEDPHCQHRTEAHHIAILHDGMAMKAKLDECAAYIDTELALCHDVLVHCSAGMERSPLTIAWWMVKTGVVQSIQEAYKILMIARPIVQDREHWIEGNYLSEQEKYEKMWGHESYRHMSPGEGVAQVFLKQAKPKPGSQVIDFGTGTGRGALMLAILGGCKVNMLDFARNCLDGDVRDALTTQAHMLEFHQHDLTQKVPYAAEYGFCTDVMEHIPPHNVGVVLVNILRAAQHCFFQIACEPDRMGALIGEQLHLTVKPHSWWLNAFKGLDCIVHWSEDHGTHCMFYVTAWQTGKQITEVGVLNLAEEKCLANVKQNVKGNWKEASPHHQPNEDVEVAILGGGWSLDKSLEELKILKASGVKIVTLNGAYKWALDNDLGPVSQIIVDARPHNARFVQPVREDCVYLIASQCDPSVFEQLPEHRTIIWHTSEKLFKEVLDERYQTWYNVPGGSTVLLRSLPLLRMLGFRKFHLFGCDSCLQEGQHHAYPQPENDGDLAVAVSVGGRQFTCYPWMASQASEFMDLIGVFGNEIELEVYGDGLIAHILTTGARLADEDMPALP